MLAVLLVFFGVFLCRDVQLLALQQRKLFPSRFATYAAMQIAGAIAGTLVVVGLPASRDVASALPANVAGLAWSALLLQVAELALAATLLTRWASGRYSWIGLMLPSPAFLFTLVGMSLLVQDHVTGIPPMNATLAVTAAWLAIVGCLAFAINRTDCSFEDRRFASDFALLTSCTALVFIPYGML